jgi:hypothetical protein
MNLSSYIEHCIDNVAALSQLAGEWSDSSKSPESTYLIPCDAVLTSSCSTNIRQSAHGREPNDKRHTIFNPAPIPLRRPCRSRVTRASAVETRPRLCSVIIDVAVLFGSRARHVRDAKYWQQYGQD